VLKLVVLLLVLAFVASRVLPRRRLPWAVPVAVVVTLLVVRTVGWLTGD
jgi:Na+-translocating ferredoxin:NAD+ oxidoreductase RnfD subunit